MSPLQIITEALQKIPAAVRFWINVLFSLVVVAVSILAVLDVELAYDKINQVLIIVGGYLGVQSAANVPGNGKRSREPV